MYGAGLYVGREQDEGDEEENWEEGLGHEWMKKMRKMIGLYRDDYEVCVYL